MRMRSTKPRLQGLIIGIAALASTAQAQPPQKIEVPGAEGFEPPNPAKPVAPLVSVEELNQLIGGPTLLTMHFKDAPAPTVYEELVKQSGVKFNLWPDEELDAKKLVTVDFEREAFWPALQTLLPKLGLAPMQLGGSPGQIITLRRSDGAPPALQNKNFMTALGPCTLFARGVNRFQSANVNLGNADPRMGTFPEKQESLSVRLEAFIDPKLRVNSALSRVTLEEAVDNTGKSLLPGPRSAFGNFNSFLGSPSSLQLSLTRPSKAAKNIVRVRGTLHLVVATRQEIWEVPDILKATEMTRTIAQPDSEQVLTIEPVKSLGDNRYEFRVKVLRRQAGAAAVNPRANARRWGGSTNSEVFKSLRLVDENGRDLLRGGSSGGGVGNELTFQMTFTRGNGFTINRNGERVPMEPKVGEPAKLIWPIPTEDRELKVPFEFTDLPIPQF